MSGWCCFFWISLFDLRMLFWCPQIPAEPRQVPQILPADLPGEQAQHHGAVFHLLSPSDCSLSILFEGLEHTQDHLLIWWQISWLLRAGDTGDRDHLGFSLSLPEDLHVFHIAEGFQQKWRAYSILGTKLSEDKALFLECELRRKGNLCSGGEVSAELKLFSWYPFLLVNYLALRIMKNSLLFVDLTNSGAWLLSHYQIQVYSFIVFVFNFSPVFLHFSWLRKEK